MKKYSILIFIACISSVLVATTVLIKANITHTDLKDNVSSQTNQTNTQQDTDTIRIQTQLTKFETFLETEISNTDLYCDNYANYHNYLARNEIDPDFLKQAFPDGEQVYKEQCSLAYSHLLLQRNILIAEPELQPLRKILSEYTDKVAEFSLYTLNGGYKTSTINDFDKTSTNLKTLSKEEILRVKREYGL